MDSHFKPGDAALFIDRKGRRYLKILRPGVKLLIRGELMADDVVFVHGNALMQSKAEFLEAARARRFRISSFEIANPKVVFFGGGAIVSGVEDIVLGPRAAREQPRKVQMRVSAVWVARPGGWQLILQQSTPFQPLTSQPPAPSTPPR